EGVPEVRRVRCLTNDLGEVSWVSDVEVKPVDAVRDLLCHSPNVATNNRPAVGERLLNDQRRVFPPDRRDKYPIDGGHEPWQLRVGIRPHERDILRRRLQQRPELVLVVARLEVEVCPVDPQMRFLGDVWPGVSGQGYSRPSSPARRASRLHLNT